MMIRILIAVILFLPLISYSQLKKLTIEDAVWGRYYNFPIEDLDNLQWKEYNSYTFISDNKIKLTQISNFKDKTYLTIDNINQLLEKKGIEPLSYLGNFKWIGKDLLYLVRENQHLFIDGKNKMLQLSLELPDNADNIELCNINQHIAYTTNNNLYIKTPDNKEIKVTNEENNDIVCGQVVHRNEFGIENGSYWSPKGNYIAFYRKDESMVTDYPLVDVNYRIAKLDNIKYPMAGMTSHEVTLGIYSLKNNKTIYIKTGEPKDQYLTNIAWSPDERYIYIAILNRGQDYMELKQFDATTGDYVKVLFTEKNEKYVEPLKPMKFLQQSSDKFLWQSRRDGYNHIYLYNTNGELIKQITKGDWEVIEYLGVDKAEEFIFYTSTQESPIEQHIYKVSMISGEVTKLTHSPGVHKAYLSENGGYIIDEFSNVKTPKKINIINSSGKVLKTIKVSYNPLAEFEIPEMTISTLVSNDGDSLYYRMIKPSDFNPEKKYPVMLYVYGGPHVQLIQNRWLGDASLWNYYMAQEGYVVFTVDNRGSANRGFEFESATFGNLGEVEMEDQLIGINYLKSLPFIDTSKIGVFGWSYGGFMTISLMLNYPDIFKVGVAGGPVTSWKFYEVMYTERYMDATNKNPNGYKKTDLNALTDKLEGRLLIIHGAQDPVVVWQHSLRFVNSCIKEGKLIDYFVYPNHKHNVRGYDRIHLMRKVTQYFNDFLK